MMRKITTNLAVLFMAGCLAVSGALSIPVPAMAAQAYGQTDTLTRVTKAVKERLTIPKKLTEFSYKLYETDGSRPLWYLTWSDKKSLNSVFVAADFAGRIYSYRYDKERQADTCVPKYGRSALKKKAEDFIKKTAPGIKGKLSFQEAVFNGMYSGEYCFTWVRKENGIPVPQNKAEVSVNCETGEVVRYEAQYSYGLSLPGGTAAVSAKDAKAKIKKTMKMQLKYFTGSQFNENGKRTDKAFLAYVPEYTYIAVDAVSGEVYMPETDHFFLNEGNSFKEDAATDAGGRAGLTGEEIGSIEEITGILSAKEAREAVEGSEELLFHEGMTRVNTRLYERGAGEGYVWEMSFETPEGKDEKEGERHYAEALVDAKTGCILSYYTDYDNAAKAPASVSLEEGRTKLEAFARTQAPQYADSVRFAEEADEKDYGYRYWFQRYYKDIPYSGNGITGYVEPAEGKIVRFFCSWDSPKAFDNPAEVIGEDRAYDLYLNLDGFEKVYEIDAPMSGSPRARLVYHTNIQPAYISALTGKQVSGNGEIYKPHQSSYTYSDIKGHRAGDAIRLLGDMGIGFAGGKFKPEQAITKAELKAIFDRLNITLNRRYVDNLTGKSTITRMDAARLSLRAVGMKNAAELKNVYQVRFADKNKIAAKDAGYAVLAEGLGLLSLDKNSRLRPDQKLTRAEAAEMIVAVLTLR